MAIDSRRLLRVVCSGHPDRIVRGTDFSCEISDIGTNGQYKIMVVAFHCFGFVRYTIATQLPSHRSGGQGIDLIMMIDHHLEILPLVGISWETVTRVRSHARHNLI